MTAAVRSALLAFALLATEAAGADVVVLKSGDVEAWRPALEALRKSIPSVLAEHDLRNDPTEAARIVESVRGQDVILVAFGPLAARAARQVAADRPLVYGFVLDPGALGLEGPQVAGVLATPPAKLQLTAFRSLFAGAARLGVVHSSALEAQMVQVEAAARVMGIGLTRRPIASPRELSQALRGLISGPDAVAAVWLPADAVLLDDETRRFVLAEATKAGKPVLTFSPAIVAEGALAAQGVDYASIGEQMAAAVRRIQAGEAPDAIGQLVPRAQLTINQRVADRLRVTLRPEALRSAQVVR
jgi:ABC-type uncharacterized transport system substrate-binding protein